MKKTHGYAIGIAVVLLAVIVAATVMAYPLAILPTTNSSTTSNTSTTSTGTGQPSNGKVGVLATDPPIMASGVSSASVVYNGVALHSEGSDSASGWVQVAGSGTFELSNSAGVSQTLASANIKGGSYDKVRLNVTSGSVVYNGQTYAATVTSGTLTANLRSAAQVSGSATTEALLDIQTYVFNTGNSSNAQFVISTCAKATTVPPSAVTTASLQVGARASLQGQAWFTSFEDQTSAKVSISAGAISSNGVSFDISNTGNASADIETVIITPVSGSASSTLSLSGSAILSAGGSGSLQSSNSLQTAVLFTGDGTQVSSGSSITLDYSGGLSLGFGLGSINLTGVVSGQQYLVTVIGANAYASAIVVAH
jgi:Domain of unknown function (DUF4382)